MDKSKLCNVLGTPRIENWPVVFNYLIRLIHAEFNIRCRMLF